MKIYKGIGLMSGTSLDGLDIAYCKFQLNDEKWEYEILHAETYAYTEEWENKLRLAPLLSGRDLILLHNEYGRYLGAQVNKYLSIHKNVEPEFIASHGHTIFHQPEKQMTFQIGNAASIAAETKKTVIADFRSLDVAMGGQGAPLVPIGDTLLFGEYDFCINLGGFANISFKKNNIPLAFDICPANFVINKVILDAKIPVKDFFCISNKSEFLSCDPDGYIASKGKPNMQMLNKLNEIKHYKIPGPKSLGEEWVNENIYPIFKEFNLSIENTLNTFYHHIVMQIQDIVEREEGNKILISGGGAYNKYLIKLLKKHISKNITIPSKKIIEYKEAMIFAFMGLLRILQIENSLSSVTGSSANSIGGSVYLGKII